MKVLFIFFVLCVTRILAASTALPIGNLTNWRQIFTDDFTTNVELGSFPGPYENKWMSYTGFSDTSGVGWYDQYKVLSVKNGYLDFYMHTDTETGKPLGAAPIPYLNSDGYWSGMIYGRYSIRFRADSLPNYGTGWLLWPDTNEWNEGEIDFPEGGLDGSIHGFVHCIGNPSSNCYAVDTETSFTDWHIATIEWTPTYVKFLLDGKDFGNSTNAVPNTKFHWVLQAATTGTKPLASVAGHIQIDWVSIWAWDTSIVASPTGTPTNGQTSSASATSSPNDDNNNSSSSSSASTVCGLYGLLLVAIVYLF